MDDRDKLLLNLLKRDARRPIVALARDLNLSRSATQERLAKLQSSGMIAGFTIVEGRSEGSPETAYLMVTFDPGQRCEQIVPKLKRIPSISMIHSVTGPVDLVVRVDGRNVAEIEAGRAAITAIPGVASVSTSMVLERHLG
ncbi:MAG: Lrp/AsnC family transcriptional regulator [Sphingosinicella sp.]|nr:Lrp/AsnC family transcriptional regulator [Sphingosinicella sp.]